MRKLEQAMRAPTLWKVGSFRTYERACFRGMTMILLSFWRTHRNTLIECVINANHQ
ncbi:hypothetical protein HMPREF3232_00799 [Fannyhessea vaginae]|nr:hypothetical protein HMPREF3232_00799 [Fannyhessea vaginae]